MSGGGGLSRNHLTAPPPDPLPARPRVRAAPAGREFLRIFDPVPRGDTELIFRHWGPRLRFDHQRAPITSPAIDEERGVWYGAPREQVPGGVAALELCLWESFGSGRRIELRCALAHVRVRGGEELQLLSLVDADAADAGTIAQLAATADVEMSQAWSRYFWEHPEIYGEIDGLLYRSAWVGAVNVCLYERAKAKIESVGVGSMLLSDPLLVGEIAAIAHRRGSALNASSSRV